MDSELDKRKEEAAIMHIEELFWNSPLRVM
jgi:hypothetical protein